MVLNFTAPGGSVTVIGCGSKFLNLGDGTSIEFGAQTGFSDLRNK